MGYTFLLIGVTAVWGWTFVVVRDAVGVYSVLGFLTFRFAIAALAVGGFAVRRLRWETIRVGGGVGFALAVGYYLQTLGLRYTTSTNSVLITGLFVVFTPLAEWVLFGVPPTFFSLVAVGSGALGMALLTGSGPSSLRMGDALTLGCAAAFGVHIALLSRFAKDHAVSALTFVQLGTCAVVFGFAWGMSEPVTMPPSGVWFALWTTAIVASAVGFFVQTAVQSRLPAVRTAVILTAEPMFGMIFGYFLAGDRLSPVQVSGAGLIVGALIFSEVVPRLTKGTLHDAERSVSSD